MDVKWLDATWGARKPQERKGQDVHTHTHTQRERERGIIMSIAYPDIVVGWMVPNEEERPLSLLEQLDLD